jgi:hypothetical protein
LNLALPCLFVFGFCHGFAHLFVHAGTYHLGWAVIQSSLN